MKSFYNVLKKIRGIILLIPKQLVVLFIIIYRKCISPLFPPTCKFRPTCSQYALQAVRKYGFFKGGLLAAWRLLRCSPFSKGGYDPLK